MKALIYFMFLSVLKNFGFYIVTSSTNNKKTFLIKNKTHEIFLQRSKRYLVFDKGATLTVQGNIAKSIIPPAPRGLNVITEYTLSYELPSDFIVFRREHLKAAKSPVISTTTTTANPSYHHPIIVPYSHDYLLHMHPEYMNSNSVQRKYSHYKKKTLQRRCLRKRFYVDDLNEGSNICLLRGKRGEDWSLSKLTVSQRLFYDLIEKWSLLHGLLPRYCFMRTLCETSEFLLPHGHSLLHDIIHILLRYTKPWAFHHKIFGRSLRQWHSIDECAKSYGLYCRVSWFEFITNVVYGSRAADLMH